jgi:hypothetical protein
MALARTKPGSIIESLAPRRDHIDRDIAGQGQRQHRQKHPGILLPVSTDVLQLQLICNNAEPDPVAGCRDQAAFGGMEDVRGGGVA